MRSPSSKNRDINFGELAGARPELGNRGRSDCCTHLLRLTRRPWLEVAPQERPPLAIKSPTLLPQKSDIKLVGNAGESSVVAIVIEYLPELTCPPWLGEVELQEQLQPVVSRICSQRSDIKTEGNTVTGSGPKGGSDRCRTLTRADMLEDQPVADSPIPLSQKCHLSSTRYTGGSRGGSDRCNPPTKADMPRR